MAFPFTCQRTSRILITNCADDASTPITAHFKGSMKTKSINLEHNKSRGKIANKLNNKINKHESRNFSNSVVFNWKKRTLTAPCSDRPVKAENTLK